MGNQFGLDGFEQADLGGHLGGQVGKSHGRVLAVEVDRGLGRRYPLPGSLGALMLLGHLGDQLDKTGLTQVKQVIWVGVAFQYSQVGRSQIAGQRAHGHQLSDQVLDPYLVLGASPGQPVSGPNPPVQRSALRTWQL